jgi:hydrogenase maturation factor
VAVASDVGMRVRKDAIPVRPEVRAVCDFVGIDPYVSISEGTLIATVRPERAIGYVEACAREGIDAAVVGDVTELSAGRVVVDENGEQALEHPGLDPFWGAFGSWASEAAAAG